MSFRLPEFTRDWQVTQQARISPQTALAKAAPAIAAGRAIGQTAQAVADTTNVFYQREMLQRERDGQVSIYAQDAEFLKKNASKEYYTAEELPPEIIPDGMATKIVVDDMGNQEEVPNDKIPAHLVYPTLYKKNMDSWIAASADGLLGSESKSKFTAANKIMAEKRYGQALLNSSKQQVKYQRAEDNQLYDEMMRDGAYDAALSVVETSQSLTPAEKSKMKQDTHFRAELDIYDGAINSTSIDEMNRQIKVLSDPEYSGVFNETEQRKQISLLRTGIRRQSDTNDTSKREYLQGLKDQASTVKRALEAGEPVSAEMVFSLQSKLNTAGETFDAADIDVSLSVNEPIRKMRLASSAERNGLMAAWEGKEAKTPTEIKQRSLLRKANAEITRLQNTDMVSLQRMNSPGKIPVIDFSKQGALKQLGGRVNQMVQAATDMDSFTGFLDKTTELPQFVDKIKQMSWNEKADYIPRINMNIGKQYSKNFYDQLIAAGVDTNFAVAGQISQKYGHEAAVSVLRGSELRKENPALLKDQSNEMFKWMSENLDPAYRGDPTRQGAMRDAFQSIYADMADSTGDYSWKPDNAKAALQQVTGGVIEYNGSTFPAMTLGDTDKTMSRWVKDTSPVILLDQGYTGTMAEAKRIWKDLKDGDIQLLPRGEGSWAMIYNDTKSPIKNMGSDDAFILNYNPSATSRDTQVQTETVKLMSRINSMDYGRATETSIQGMYDELQNMKDDLSIDFYSKQKTKLLREKRIARERAKQWK